MAKIQNTAGSNGAASAIGPSLSGMPLNYDFSAGPGTVAPTKSGGKTLKVPATGYGPNSTFTGGEGFLNNPYGPALGPESYGKSAIFGGSRDLLKSLATRQLGVQGLQEQMNIPAMPIGLESALTTYAGGNPQLMNLLINYLPEVQTQALMQKESYLSQLRDLMKNAYVLGGGLFGGKTQAWSQAKEIDKARRAARTQELQGIVGGAMRGLGLNQYGEADTTEGLIGGMEM